MSGEPAGTTSLDELVERARVLARSSTRTLLGVTGEPGAGKSTLAEMLLQRLGKDAVLVGMDGFHLAEAELKRLGRHQRKGAPDTFDVAGYVALLTRLKNADEDVVYAPSFDRSLEESIAGSVPVPAELPLVITEGNYLLLREGAWSVVAGLLDECWYVEVDDDLRQQRLIRRHMAFGRSHSAAVERSLGSDQRNASIIAATRDRASLVVRPFPQDAAETVLSARP